MSDNDYLIPEGAVLSPMQAASGNGVVSWRLANPDDPTTWEPNFKSDVTVAQVRAALAILALHNATIGTSDAKVKALIPNLMVTDRSANFSFIVPAGHAIRDIYIKETAGFAITGGLRIGTTNGGNDVLSGFAVGANSIPIVKDAVLLKRAFSLVADQTLFVQAVTSWNGAHITGRVFLDRLIA